MAVRQQKEKPNSFYEKSLEVFMKWDKNIFRNLLYGEYLFLREFELVTVEDYAERMHGFMLEKGSANIMAARINQSLIHEMKTSPNCSGKTTAKS